MIRRLLIANRGEIAVRIMRACRELGIESVAVYTDADAAAQHRTAADRAMGIGPADSYLSIDRILGAARASGADGVHPGYGFLSENPSFAEAVEASGLVFVGPTAQTIARMGSKIEARRIMQAAGVPVVPGEMPDDQSDEGLRRAVARVGFPALVKASAGGGGRGMRVVRAQVDALEAIGSARREAAAAFGDGTLYVETLIEHARHVEVQIFGDAHGRVVHLFERDCSVQRRHQKIVEESPSPVVSPSLRARLTQAAEKAGRAVSYRSAGTIEFLVDAAAGAEAAFYFLEMNTRLQVEHPVTEAVAGVDLVRAQLLVAAGQPLPWGDAAPGVRGHAIEARVYAEDPASGFLPQAGRLILYREPRLPGVRIDSGVAEGDEVSVHYDPLLAKVIAWAEDRDRAIARLSAALRSFPILGIATNLEFLVRLIEDPRFRDARVDTTTLDAEPFPAARDRVHPPAHVIAALAAHEADAADAGHGIPGPGVAPDVSRWDPWRTLGRRR